MTRSEIITRFRQENPEITSNVASDSVLESWCQVGDKEVCAKTRVIKEETEITASIGISQYDLVNVISKFYDINEYPGGGVNYNNKRLDMETKASLDQKRPSWRSASNGTPVDYYRRNQYMILGTPPDAANTIIVDAILVSDDFDDDNKLPFNELTYLEPFHYSIVLYLAKRVFSGKVKKPGKAESSEKEYNDFVTWMKGEVNRGTHSTIQMRSKVGYRGTSRHGTR